jgi:hypothetical protein
MFMFWKNLSYHTFYLLPLCFEAAIRIRLIEKFFELFLVLDLMVDVKLNKPKEIKNLEEIRAW